MLTNLFVQCTNVKHMNEQNRVGLTSDVIVDAALTYADRHGLDSLTMRKLAAELGTAPMTMYYHVPSKEHLVDMMVERVFDEIDPPPADSDWKSAIRKRYVSARSVLNHHPWAPPLMESRNQPGPASLRHHDAVIGCFRRAGFSLQLTAHAYAVLDSFLYGFAFEEATLPGDTREAYQPIVEQIAGEMESGGLKHLAEFTRDHVMKPDYRFGSSFEFGLDLILDGLERALEAAPSRTGRGG